MCGLGIEATLWGKKPYHLDYKVQQGDRNREYPHEQTTHHPSLEQPSQALETLVILLRVRQMEIHPESLTTRKLRCQLRSLAQQLLRTTFDRGAVLITL